MAENDIEDDVDGLVPLERMLPGVKTSDDLVEFLRVLEEEVEDDGELREVLLRAFLIQLISHINSRKTHPDAPPLPEQTSWKLFAELIMEGVYEI